MFSKTRDIYLATRKKHDLVFNTYFMRPIAAFVVGVLVRRRASRRIQLDRS